MPTGITADIYEGKDVSLRDYLMRVGRQMSLAIMQRDDDPRTPVKRREVSSYEQKRVAEAQAKLSALAAMSVEQAQAASEQSDAERAEALEHAVRKDAELRERYDSMLHQVEEWEPAPKVEYVKEHAIKFLRESIEHDCSDDPTYYYPRPEGLSGAAWLDKARADAQAELARAETRLAEELARVADFNEHIDAFLASLPPEPAEEYKDDPFPAGTF